MLKIILLIITIIFFALNMGGSGIAPAFSVSYGSKMIKRNLALIFFTIFVILGAITIGGNVVKTLSGKIIPNEIINFDIALIILLSATLSLTIANLVRIPQSTSMVTVGAIIGTGLFFNQINWKFLIYMFSFWVVFPALSYFLTYHIYKRYYPPAKKNIWFYRVFTGKENSLRLFTIISGCYCAFALGTNNVANAVGPLVGAEIINPLLGLLLISPIFGLGALIFGKKTINTFGNDIISLDISSAPLIMIICSTLLIISSSLGYPMSFVQLICFSILAISSVKNGHINTMRRDIVKRIFLIWIFSPLFSAILAFILLSL
ncbi:MAG: anion permease [Bacteroidota bacterium]